MKLKSIILGIGLILVFYVACSSSETQEQEKQEESIEQPQEEEEEEEEEEENNENANGLLKILSLGDSYTIGESVCTTCRFPEQLKDSIIKRTGNGNINLKVIATTGWTTTNLKNAILNEELENDYDLATLLIGVNNQFQGKPFSLFEIEFPQLVNLAISSAKGEQKRLIVISIPDYAYTPFGNGSSSISDGIDRYNDYIENYCNENGITYVFITDITREGLQKPELVANDGLHPSEVAYTEFVKRILPEALDKIGFNSN
ncbi:SGNH/GDSL hydrolase family protein [Seonamhaeicola marinus]|uniref:SGNH/GDSL hydrolase family protein n=1 Tax=Seonamhaeicola marinus TaxID=1912246 RepID=A0A5D0HIB9_9FLAO|nr:SGNH/GDSL hydrolase family protein [Seonamhaeicola marinus]TYA70019.1 SGNH/GDSL hydrolase family protein [Seonamhaeicola marinus]